MRFNLVSRVPWQALLAAGVALASYGTTTIIKRGIDEEIGRYSSIIERANFVENINIVFPITQSQLHILKEQVALQKYMILALGQRQMIESSDLSRVVSFNPHELRADSQQDFIFTNFVGSLEADVRRRSIPAGRTDLDPKGKGYSLDQMINCAVNTVDLSFVTPLTSTYAALLGAFGSLKNNPDTIATMLQSLADRRAVVLQWPAAIRDKLSLDKVVNPFDSKAVSLRSDQERAVHVFAERCLNLASAAIRDDYRIALWVIRETVRSNFISPLQIRKEIVGFVEICLYLVGALLALSKEIKPEDDLIT